MVFVSRQWWWQGCADLRNQSSHGGAWGLCVLNFKLGLLGPLHWSRLLAVLQVARAEPLYDQVCGDYSCREYPPLTVMSRCYHNTQPYDGMHDTVR